MQFPADFTAREQALLGPRFAELYAYATPQPARGVTVNGLRCTPEWFAAHADFAAALSPFCPTAFTTAPDFKPGRHPWHHAGVFYAQEPSFGPGCAAGCTPRHEGGGPLRRPGRQD